MPASSELKSRRQTQSWPGNISAEPGLEQPAIDPILMLASLLGAPAMQGIRSFAGSVPETLGNEAGALFPKGYAEQKFPFSQKFKVQYPNDPEMFYDDIKGLNKGHAVYRAKDNWPGANVQMTGFSDAGAQKAEMLHGAISKLLKEIRGLGI